MPILLQNHDRKLLIISHLRITYAIRLIYLTNQNRKVFRRSIKDSFTSTASVENTNFEHKTSHNSSFLLLRKMR
ncbi:hypothetical protein Cflav_PD5027 [Pedosphaera parvula Ellin514]|uniref:Uncharacterized protein n=1 Tax=Pedosphaera parvula (strain Ellin514) TaxID=320771 RepID=B9XD46_PEDPL|nr:hypothetical protein Cflav_PD5027 [Pedosphaera parvula Ellin514]